MSLLNQKRAAELGFSLDKRKRRRQHRRQAKNMLVSGGFFNGLSSPGSTLFEIAQWHKEQARAL
jgi:hypothetical protein